MIHMASSLLQCLPMVYAHAMLICHWSRLTPTYFCFSGSLSIDFIKAGCICQLHPPSSLPVNTIYYNIWSLDGIITDTTTLVLIERWINGNEGVLHISQIPRENFHHQMQFRYSFYQEGVLPLCRGYCQHILSPAERAYSPLTGALRNFRIIISNCL